LLETEMTKHTRRSPPVRATLAPNTVDSLTQLQLVKADLEAVSLRLMEIDETRLSPEKRRVWEDEVDKVDLAIGRARTALLTSLSDAFSQELPAIEAATGKLADSLEKLEKVSEVIDAVAGVLGVIEKVISLGR
jgi:hypothetical protein